MKNRALIEQIVPLIGGKENIQTVVHCMTRLRFTLKDQSLAKTEEIKNLDKVIDVVSNKISYQIIIGTEVADLYPELLSYIGMEDSESSEEIGIKKNIVKRVLDVMSESITPIIPAIMATALLSGILSIFTVSGLLSAEGDTFLLLDSIRKSLFYFLPVFIAVSAAKRLGAPLYLAILLAVSLLSPTINGVEGLELFGIPLPTTTYSNTFISTLLGVWFMGIVAGITKRVVPKSLEFFFSPLIIILVTFPITLFFFGPIGTWISEGLTFVVNFLTNTFGGWLVIALYAACQPFLIMLGAGNFIIPIILNFFATVGYDPVFVPAYIISDFAVSGAMLGYMLRVKDTKQKQFFGTVSFSAFMGVTEPAVFGAFLKYRRPFFAVMIGGGLGGLFAGLMHVKGYAFTNLFGIMTFIGENDYNNFYYMIIALIIGFVGAATAGFFLGIPKGEQQTRETKKIENKKVVNKVLLDSPVKGDRVPLHEINDQAFSSGALGKGIGILPNENIIKAPISGEVVSLFPTHHAIGIRSDDGVEVLIHIGINTVELEGKHFSALVNQGDIVKQGQEIIQVDFEQVINAGYDPTVIIVITNTQDYLEIIPNLSKEQDLEKGLLTVIL